MLNFRSLSLKLIMFFKKDDQIISFGCFRDQFGENCSYNHCNLSSSGSMFELSEACKNSKEKRKHVNSNFATINWVKIESDSFIIKLCKKLIISFIQIRSGQVLLKSFTKRWSI